MISPVERFNRCRNAHPREHDEYRRAQDDFREIAFELSYGHDVKILREHRSKLRTVGLRLSNTRKAWMKKLKETK